MFCPLFIACQLFGMFAIGRFRCILKMYLQKTFSAEKGTLLQNFFLGQRTLKEYKVDPKSCATVGS